MSLWVIGVRPQAGHWPGGLKADAPNFSQGWACNMVPHSECVRIMSKSARSLPLLDGKR